MYTSFWAQVEKCGFKSDYTYIAGLCPTYADSALKSIEVRQIDVKVEKMNWVNKFLENMKDREFHPDNLLFNITWKDFRSFWITHPPPPQTK